MTTRRDPIPKIMLIAIGVVALVLFYTKAVG